MRRSKNHILSSFVFYILYALYAQAQTIELPLNELTFHSEFEKSCFYNLENDSGVKNMFMLGLAIDKSVTKETAEAFYDAFLKPQEKILFNKIKKDRPNTVDKFLYKTIHEIYLNKYEVGTSFFELMGNGQFNCVSSSILFALIFEKYGVPYAIKKLPDHVYLLLYPESKKPIRIETTNPISGYVLYSNFFKENYIKDLYKGNIISQGVYDAYSTDELFNIYFFNDEDLTLKELFSLQYLNNTLTHYSDKDYKSALINAEKAYYLNPDSKIESIINATVSLSLQDNTYESMEDFRIYAKAINYNLNTLNEDQKLDIFEYVTQRYLFDKPDEELYHKIYSFLIKQIKSKDWLNKISTIYYTELCRINLTYSTGQKEALDYGLKALELSPVTYENQRLVYNSFYEKNKSENPYVAYNELSKILKVFPHLIENKMFSELKGNLLLNSIQWAFQSQKPDIGNKSLNEFENFMDKYPELSLNNSLITRAFSEEAIYYFKLDEKNKSIEVLEEGLKYAPTSYELKNRLNQLTQ